MEAKRALINPSISCTSLSIKGYAFNDNKCVCTEVSTAAYPRTGTVVLSVL